MLAELIPLDGCKTVTCLRSLSKAYRWPSSTCVSHIIFSPCMSISEYKYSFLEEYHSYLNTGPLYAILNNYKVNYIRNNSFPKQSHSQLLWVRNSTIFSFLKNPIQLSTLFSTSCQSAFAKNPFYFCHSLTCIFLGTSYNVYDKRLN